MAQKFIVGRPIRGGENFVNRQSELSAIFNRITNGDSVAVVGPPRIGKSSVLKQIQYPVTQRQYLSSEADNLVVVFLDLLSVGADYDSRQFWAEVIRPLRKHPPSPEIIKQIEEAEKHEYGRLYMEDLFDCLHEEGKVLVLLLDEFDRLLVHPNFQEHAFYALLRSLSTHSGSLVCVTATRVSVSYMEAIGRRLLDAGSPVFNHLWTVNLRPFDSAAVQTLINQAVPIFEKEVAFVRNMGGGHPFLLQAVLSCIEGAEGLDRCSAAAQRFYDHVSSQFDDLWTHMDDGTRTTAVILTLVHMGGSALGKDYAFKEIGQVERFGPYLKQLEDLGLAQRAVKGWSLDWENAMIWQGDRWVISSEAFCWWVRDVIIAEVRKPRGYDQWLEGKAYRTFMTQEQWDGLVKNVRSMPEWVGQSIATLATAVFDGWMKGS